MAKKKGIDVDKYAAGLFTRTEQYADRVRRHYATAVEELLKLSAGRDLNGSGAFSFADSRRLSTKANKILRSLYSAVYQEIKGGVSAEWEYANLSADSLIGAMFGKKLREDDHLARWFSRNQEAMDAFFKRKSAYGGLNLSQKVWRYTGDLKTEMEVALSVCLGQGDSAAAVSRKVRKYLQEPDSMFRRFRVKTGVKDVLDGDGNKVGTESVYGRVWKRKVIDPQTAEVTWKTFNPKDYHSGRGVYRSSYKNAMRLTRTETNMAYRTAEQDRWQRLDFVLGYRVMLSNNHPCDDICNDLSAKNGDTASKRGVYPKDFVFKGWHPQCRCVCTPILADEDAFVEMRQALLDGEEPATPQGMVRKPNEEFYSWVDANRKRIEKAQTVPYWVQDNQDYFNSKSKKKVKTIISPIAATGVSHVLSEIKLETAINKIRKKLVRQEREKMVVLSSKGVTILETDGTSLNVFFDGETAKKIADATITHNHPTGKNQTGVLRFGYSLSSDDVYEAIRCNTRGIIAEAPYYRYSIERPNNGWRVDSSLVRERYREVHREISERYGDSLLKHHATNIVQHLTMKLLAKEFGFTYKYEKKY